MDLNYSPEETAFRDEVRGWLAENLPADLKEKVATYAHLSKDDLLRWHRILAKKGWIAPAWPQEWGGTGWNVVQRYIFEEECGYAGAPPLIPFGLAMCGPVLIKFGSPAQKKQFLPRIYQGEDFWCQGYSEPGAGSDLASLKTRAVRDGDHYVVNGQKTWTTMGQHANMIFCLVRTAPDARKQEGISFLLIDMATKGVEVRPIITLDGEHEVNEVFFTDVRVPKANVVGGRGRGWFVANTTLKHERGMLGDPNATEARLNALIELMKTETVGAERIVDNAIFRDRLMQLQARVFAMKFNGMRLLTAAQTGEGAGLAGLVVKLQGCELNHQIAALAIDALGELGVLYHDGPHLRAKGSWQRSYMFDLGLIIGGGTAQIQKNIISERGLGMPREPRPAKA